MENDYKYSVVKLYEIEELRKRKVADYKGQVSDYLEEAIVTYEAQCVAIYNHNEKIGYFCVGIKSDLANKILEFYLQDMKWLFYIRDSERRQQALI